MDKDIIWINNAVTFCSSSHCIRTQSCPNCTCTEHLMYSTHPSQLSDVATVHKLYNSTVVPRIVQSHSTTCTLHNTASYLLQCWTMAAFMLALFIRLVILNSSFRYGDIPRWGSYKPPTPPQKCTPALYYTIVWGDNLLPSAPWFSIGT